VKSRAKKQTKLKIKIMHKEYRDLAISVALIVISCFLFRETSSIPAPRFEPLGSAFFPRLILISMIILSAGVIIQSIFRIFKNKKKEFISIQVAEPKGGGGLRYVWAVTAILAAYILLMSLSIFNFFALTFVFLFLLTFFFGFGRLDFFFPALAVAAIVTAGIYFFGKLLHLILP
jgi:putative tricarboxylic transport membrane protein